jgi:hypothetical protein
MKRSDALKYIGHHVDDAQSTDEKPVTCRTTLVGWQCGFEPMFVAVNSYLPDCIVDESEAIDLAWDSLDEKGWFDGSESRPPDYVFEGEHLGDFECYLLVTELRSGQEWVTEIKGKMILDLETRVKAWIRKEFDGELHLNGRIMPKIEGDYYASIITDWRPRNSVVVWQGGGFYLR